MGSDMCTASMDHRGWGLGIKVFVVSLSTPSAQQTRNLTPLVEKSVSDAQSHGGRDALIRLKTKNEKELLYDQVHHWPY